MQYARMRRATKQSSTHLCVLLTLLYARMRRATRTQYAQVRRVTTILSHSNTHSNTQSNTHPCVLLTTLPYT